MPKIEGSEISVSELYPKIPREDIREVEVTIRRYLTAVRHVFDHIQRENPRILTELRRCARLRKQKARI